MAKKIKFLLFILLFLAVLLGASLYLWSCNIPVLEPKGIIALKERNLLITATLLMLIIVIPVFILTFVIAWRYRASNKKATYSPDWDYNFIAEAIWWGLPCIIVAALSVLTWKTSHELDPFKPLDSNTKPLRIQVVALQWKWLFIYPDQNIATVNYLQFPEKTPLNFEITADSPMNSFWIPQLGGQIYAMPGMRTKLHLIADEVGNYNGSSANFSGTGFSGMQFKAVSSSQPEFEEWSRSIQQAPKSLNLQAYTQLAEPSINIPPMSYTLGKADLFDWIVMKYMMPMDEITCLEN